MAKDLAEQKSHLQTLVASYEELLNQEKLGNEFSDEEQLILDRIAEKLDDLRKRLDAADAQSENTGVADNGSQSRKAGRIGKLKDMQSSIAGLMAALRTAR